MIKMITVFGGSGFIGRYLIPLLAKQGVMIRVAVRHPERALFLKPLGQLGQIKLIATNIHDPQSVGNVIKGSDIVVNLVGILYQRGSQKFHNIHIQAAKNIANAVREYGAQRFIHVSALGASAQSASLYARTKAEGEIQVRQIFPQTTIVRPSVIFGPEDQFLNRFARIAQRSLFLPLIQGHTKFQPVFVQDVAQAIIQCLADKGTQGKTYELGGPNIYEFHQLLRYVLQVTHRQRWLLRIPSMLAKIVAWPAEFLPNPPLTRDQVRLLKYDNVVQAQALSFKDLGMQPAALELVAPEYLQLYMSQRYLKNNAL
ncbi:MAG TPA: complex I NDUFA9 subunit family protein [Alphaproteobacteria bacterium]|nr:complex I NDUFA9 subunit family protein [Alphaproteobacteria bacterium]